MSSATKARRWIHEVSKWFVLLGLGLLCASAAVHTAEDHAQAKLDTLVERAARYRQTEYAERYASHARRAEKRLAEVQALRIRWGDPVPGVIWLVVGAVAFGLTPTPDVKRRRVNARKRSRARRSAGSQRSRPAAAEPRTTRSAQPRTPTQSLLGRETG